jgi:hypothetical protein
MWSLGPEVLHMEHVALTEARSGVLLHDVPCVRFSAIRTLGRLFRTRLLNARFSSC